MAIYKEIWYFSALGSNANAWTETYYATANSLQEAATYQQGFINRRLELLHPVNVFQKIRISEVGQNRVSTVRVVGQKGIAAADHDPHPPSVAVVCSMGSANPAASRRLWLRGCSTGMAWRRPDTGEDHFNPHFRTSLAAFFDMLSRQGYGILPLAKLTPGGPYPLKVLGVDGTRHPGKSWLEVNANPGIVAGNRIIVRKFSKKLLPGLDGAYQVLAVDGNEFQIQYATPEHRTIVTEEGTLRKEEYPTLGPLVPSLCGPQYISSRQTRGFFSNVRGSRRAARLRGSR